MGRERACYRCRVTDGKRPSVFAYDGAFWRRLAAMGAQRFPPWCMKYTPPFFGVAAAVAVPSARRAVIRNLRLIRGPASAWRETLEVSQTFASYAGCLAEVLANDSKNAGEIESEVFGAEHARVAAERDRGVLLLTMHTGGWELASPMFARDAGLDVLVVMEDERSAEAQAIHDRARAASGVRVMHIGKDPLDALPMIRHLREKGAVAFQIDRPPPNGRVVEVTLLGEPATIPEGPFRLAQLSGATILPVFCTRVAFRRYEFHAYPPVRLERRASAEDVQRAAQSAADAMTDFLRRHPTQWFNFGRA